MISPMGQLFIKNPSSVLGISDDNTSRSSSTSNIDDIGSKPLLLLDCFSYLTYPDNEAIYR